MTTPRIITAAVAAAALAGAGVTAAILASSGSATGPQTCTTPGGHVYTGLVYNGFNGQVVPNGPNGQCGTGQAITLPPGQTSYTIHLGQTSTNCVWLTPKPPGATGTGCGWTPPATMTPAQASSIPTGDHTYTVTNGSHKLILKVTTGGTGGAQP
jgi:hypothetical protein